VTKTVDEEYFKPTYVRRETVETVPVYTKIKIISPTPYKCQTCTEECV